VLNFGLVKVNPAGKTGGALKLTNYDSTSGTPAFVVPAMVLGGIDTDYR
jgi:hypothetical protein